MSDGQTPPETPQDLSDHQLGDYLLIHRLGRGGMAEVYLAEQSSLQRQVAVKLLRRDLAKQDGYVQRFHNEARAAAALVHANIVQIYEVGCIDDLHFLAQEYVPGQTVKQLVTRNGPLPVTRAVSILRQMTAALHKAGQGSIVHRDIKPENILISPNGEVKVADFGLARVMDPQNVDLTQAGITMGTPLYMSPEQVEGKPLDHRSDLYSSGVTMFFMLVGRPPFEGDTSLSVAVQHLQKSPPELADLRPDVPDELAKIVDRLLAKEPDRRFANAGELLKALRALPAEALDRSLPTEETTEATGDDLNPSSMFATQQLQTVMNQSPASTKQSQEVWRTWIPLAAAIAIGGLIAVATWPGPLLEVDASHLKEVPQLGTAEDQYWYAVGVNSVDAWNSVARYHTPDNDPMNALYANRAQQQLAWYYVEQKEYSRAKEIYEALSALPSNDREFKAIGQAGLVVCHYRLQENDLAREKLPEADRHKTMLNPLSPLRQELESISVQLLGS